MFDSEFNVEIPEAIEENLADIERDFLNDIALVTSELSSLADVMASYIGYLLSLEISVPDGFLALRESIEAAFVSDSMREGNSYPESVGHTLRCIKENEKAIFISLLLEKLAEKNMSLREEDFLNYGDSSTVFAYVKNTLADEAYDVITVNIPEARPKYVPSFSEGVRMLLSGEVGYCLLPIEEKGGLRLPTVENLLLLEQLKIQRIVPVFGFDGSADLKYALVAKTAYIEPYQKEDDRYLEIHIPTEKFSLSPLLFALNLYEMTLYRIHTVGVDRAGEREEYFSIVLKSQGESFVPLLSYLSLFFDRHSVVGIYKNLEY